MVLPDLECIQFNTPNEPTLINMSFKELKTEFNHNWLDLLNNHYNLRKVIIDRHIYSDD